MGNDFNISSFDDCKKMLFCSCPSWWKIFKCCLHIEPRIRRFPVYLKHCDRFYESRIAVSLFARRCDFDKGKLFERYNWGDRNIIELFKVMSINIDCPKIIQKI